MPLGSLFKLRQQPTEEIISLLEQTTLGTNGAKYRHLDTRKRIQEADQPLFLTLERNERVLGNVTFCRRGPNWYIRYFAFSSFLQAGENPKKEHKGSSQLKQQLSAFFSEVLEGESFDHVDRMYAYIEPRNNRSKWMGQTFGFEKVATLSTQSFSRIYPKKTLRLHIAHTWHEIASVVEDTYENHRFYFEEFISKPPYYVLKNDKGEVLAAARITRVNWQIVRLPGKAGKMLTKLIPYIPFLTKLIHPSDHRFLVPDAVYLKENDSKLLEELFSGILFEEKQNVILWWMDQQDPLYLSIRSKVHWGMLHRLVGITPVDVMERRAPGVSVGSGPVFVTAFDMV